MTSQEQDGAPVKKDDKTKEQLIEELAKLNKEYGQLRELVKELERRNNNLHSYIAKAPIAIFIANSDGDYIDVNQEACSLLGYSKDELLMKNIRDVALPSVGLSKFQRLKEHQLDLLAQETRHVRKDGTEVPVEFKAVAIDNNQYVSYVQDITERKKLEEELARFDRLNLAGQMAVGLGHEIRNPLTSIKGFLQLMAEKESDHRKIEYYNIMIGELDRANSIITEFLSLSKDKRVDLVPTSLNEILETLYPLMLSDAFAQDKRIQLRLGEIPNVLLDHKEIKQLTLNLVANALDASPFEGTVTIGTYKTKGSVILYISDEGPGINSDCLNKLGTPFFTTKEKGIGLGLAICYSVANRHNAAIDIKTSPSGTTFSILFNQ